MSRDGKRAYVSGALHPQQGNSGPMLIVVDLEKAAASDSSAVLTPEVGTVERLTGVRLTPDQSTVVTIGYYSDNTGMTGQMQIWDAPSMTLKTSYPFEPNASQSGNLVLHADGVHAYVVHEPQYDGTGASWGQGMDIVDITSGTIVHGGAAAIVSAALAPDGMVYGGENSWGNDSMGAFSLLQDPLGPVAVQVEQKYVGSAYGIAVPFGEIL